MSIESAELTVCQKVYQIHVRLPMFHFNTITVMPDSLLERSVVYEEFEQEYLEANGE